MISNLVNWYLNNTWLVLIFAVVLGIIVFIINYNLKNIVGMMGEHWVKQELKKLDENEYLVINNLMLKTDTTHQIDHIVISKNGIFVIETKQINGYVTGEEYDKKWIQHFGRKKYQFNNPIHQNYGHIKALSELTNIPMEKFISIICFPSRAKLNVKTKTLVLRNYNLVENILIDRNIKVDNVNQIYDLLVSNNIKNIKEKRNHIKRIKMNMIDDIDTCPKCGGKLVNRVGKYGRFIGCSNYPKCKYTKK